MITKPEVVTADWLTEELRQGVSLPQGEVVSVGVVSENSSSSIIGRLTHRCHIIEMNGDSYRFKENIKRREHGVN